MDNYKIYQHQSMKDLVAVRDTGEPPYQALGFGLWFLVRKMYSRFFIIFIAELSLVFIDFINITSTGYLLALLFIFGFIMLGMTDGYNQYALLLESKGYQHIDTRKGNSENSVIREYLESKK